ncbi:MAG: hypothetical protein K2G41_07155 [Duncaniella sp.]|uniref:hypothetical protein n=1 Tax=Duncaniella sp. TaxID=2518496 RepID=UPI0023BE4A93|nr:hypothetical protein [Duncaniella sp.]MDE6090464.1 hypothetical protein [Duncaniella sp.]
MITPSRFYESLPATARELFLKWGDFLWNDVTFNMPDSKLHAMGHCERVLFHALAMGVLEIGHDDMEALEILAHASVFHDTRRQDEYQDVGHGARAAVYYEDYCRQSDGAVTFHPEAAYLMRYHDLDDNIGREAIRKGFPDSYGRVEKLYEIFKDADALDRWRLGRWGLDVKYLRTDSARSLVDTARDLVNATMDPAVVAYYDRLIDDMMHNRQ